MLFDTQTHTQRAQGKFWAGRAVVTVARHIQRVLKAMEDRRQVRELYKWNTHELKDIGISRADVDREAMKPIHFWW